MPLRFSLTLTTRNKLHPVLEGLSDLSPGSWANWEPDTPTQAIPGVQRDVNDLAALANSFPAIFPLVASRVVERSEEHLTEWYFEDEGVPVDFTFVIAFFGRDLALAGIDGRVALVST